MSALPALPVEVVRPEKTTKESFTDYIEGLINLASNAWFVMLLVPAFDQHWSYWKSLAAVVLLGSILPSDKWRMWTRPFRKVGAK
ncbi:MAG: hypothetical protein M0Z51_11160 [Propionibacterium sp.]|nr:hypothetical protein [Propionibacterium sp.]